MQACKECTIIMKFINCMYTYVILNIIALGESDGANFSQV